MGEQGFAESVPRSCQGGWDLSRTAEHDERGKASIGRSGVCNRDALFVVIAS